MNSDRRHLAERSVLSVMLACDDDRYACVDRLEPEHFTVLMHRRVFEYIREVSSTGRPCDVMVLADLCKRDNFRVTISELNEIAGYEASRDPERFVRILEEGRRRDLLRQTGTWLLDRSNNDAESSTDLLDAAAARLFDIGRTTVRENVPLSDQIKRHMGALGKKVAAGGVDVIGAKTGLPMVDRILFGFQAPRLYLVGGRPGVGKTAMGLRLALGMAHSGHPQAFVSCEMDTPEMLDRLLSMESGVDSWRIQKGRLHEEEFDAVVRASGVLAELPIDLAYRPGLRPSELRARARRLKASMGLEVLWADYLQLMRPDREDADAPREQQVASISRKLKLIAGDLGIAVGAMAQLNRLVEQRKSKKPTLSDLRESGALEQDADCVMFVHRDQETEQAGNKPVKATLIVAKQRSGSTGEIDMLYFRERTQFEEPADESQADVFESRRSGGTHQ